MLRKVRGSRIFQAGAVLALLLLVALLGAQISHGPAAPAWGGGPRPAGVAGAPGAPGAVAVAEAPVTLGANGFVFGRSVKNDVSPPLSSIKPAPVQPATTIREMPEPAGDDMSKAAAQAPVTDPVVQRTFGSDLAIPAMPAPIRNFDGVGNIDGVYPPDTNGDVGPNHYVQMGQPALPDLEQERRFRFMAPPPATPSGAASAAPARRSNDGDPIVLYDSMADRWLTEPVHVVQPLWRVRGHLARRPTPQAPTTATSSSSAPASSTTIRKLGVWPDGYYMGANRFSRSHLSTAPAPSSSTAPICSTGSRPPIQEMQHEHAPTAPSCRRTSTEPPYRPAGRAQLLLSLGQQQPGRCASSMWTGPRPAIRPSPGPTTLTAAAFNQLCTTTRNCVQQPGTSVGSGRPGRPADAPPGLPQLGRPRIAGRSTTA